MRILTLFLCNLLFTNHAICQEKLQIFYSSDWKELSKNRGEYVREIQEISDSVYFVQDYTRKGMKLIMRGYFKSIDPFIENGPIEYFDDSGNQIIKGKYYNGEPIGIWTINNYVQIEHAELDYNFRLEYQGDSIQNRFQNNDTIASVKITSETMPSFPGGQQAIKNYFSNYTVYPYRCYLKKLNLQAVVNFTITKTGAVRNPVIVKSSGLLDYDKEVVRVIINMPRWQPGTQNGRPVDVSFSVPMSFNYQ